MAEKLLQFLWEHRLWEQRDMYTTAGERVNIIDPGLRNTGSGPDFFNAKVEIDGRKWAGNIEIHVRSSDWHRHGHQHDPAYDSIILHVVGSADIEITNRNGRSLPQLVLPYTEDFAQRYRDMVCSPTAGLACAEALADIPSIYLTDWITNLGYERLYERADTVAERLGRLDGDWLATAYVTLARALGFHTNSAPMERLAMATPVRILLKHRSDRVAVEAILAGQAGFLDNAVDDENRAYIDRLRSDCHFMSAKFGLKPPASLGWKTGAVRPPNSPYRRLAALAALVADGFEFGHRFMHIASRDDATALLRVELSGYWLNHYAYGRKSASTPQALSADSVERLIVNAVVPLLYAYGTVNGIDACCERAVAVLESLGPESNYMVKPFIAAGIPCNDGFTAQALMQLHSAYCDARKCLFCRVGHRILASKARPSSRP